MKIDGHKEPITGVLVKDSIFDVVDGDDPPQGAFKFSGDAEQRYLMYICPCGCEQLRSIPLLVAGIIVGKGWSWDGNEEAPTLAPSIRHLDRCTWHGFLQGGVWRPCNDSGR